MKYFVLAAAAALLLQSPTFRAKSEYAVALFDPLDSDSDPGRLAKLAATSGGAFFQPHDVAGDGRKLVTRTREGYHGP